MIPFDKCPVCGGEVVEKEVEKVVRGGNNTAVVRVRAEVCLHCGEKFFSKETIKKFDEIRKNLEKKQTQEYTLVGETFLVK